MCFHDFFLPAFLAGVTEAMRAVSSSSARVGGWGWGVWLEARGRARERRERRRVRCVVGRRARAKGLVYAYTRGTRLQRGQTEVGFDRRRRWGGLGQAARQRARTNERARGATATTAAVHTCPTRSLWQVEEEERSKGGATREQEEEEEQEQEEHHPLVPHTSLSVLRSLARLLCWRALFAPPTESERARACPCVSQM